MRQILQDPQNKRPMAEPAFDTPDAQDSQNKWPMSEPAPHTPANLKHQCLPRCSTGRDSNADWVFGVAAEESVHISIVLMYSFASSR